MINSDLNPFFHKIFFPPVNSIYIYFIGEYLSDQLFKPSDKKRKLIQYDILLLFYLVCFLVFKKKAEWSYFLRTNCPFQKMKFRICKHSVATMASWVFSSQTADFSTE